MADDNASTYETESGLVDDYIGTVVDAWFAVDANYNPDATLLFWKMGELETEQELPAEAKENGITERFPCGKGWGSYDGGKTIEDPERPTRKKFHESSIYGKILRKAVDEMGLGPMLASRGPSQEAAIWQGLRFHMKREEFDYGGEIGKRSRVMPAEYLGEGSASSNPAPTSGPTSIAAPSEAATRGSTESVLHTLPQDAVDKLRAIRAESETHGQFVDKAMDALTDVLTDPKITMALADESQLWKELANGE